MCGLVGVAGNLYQADVKVFNELLYADMVRGHHATGVAAIRGRSAQVLKRAWIPSDLMQLPAYDKIVTMAADVLIGHNRHGTIGNNSAHSNAHPFDFEKIVGAHNGTLNTVAVRNLHNHASFGTDSEALYSEINENGIEEAMTKVAGAWALTYFDKTTGNLHFLRNDQRTLHYAYKKGRGALYWASERGLLDWVLERNRIEIEDDEIYNVNTDVLYTWKVGRVMEAPTQDPLAASWKPPQATTTYHGGSGVRGGSEHSPWNDPNYKWDADRKMYVHKNSAASGGTSQDGAPFQGTQQTPTTQTQTANAAQAVSPSGQTGSSISTPSTATGSNVTSIEEVIERGKKRRELVRLFGPHHYKDNKGNLILKGRFDQIMLQSCCAYCGNDDINYGDPVLFLSSTNHSGTPEFLCEGCLQNPEAQELVPELERKAVK